MRTRAFAQVDVFGRSPFAGNPVAVVLDAQGLDTDRMQSIARWTNLSETTFVLPSEEGADYRLRIFTPGGELPFAGHPTLGSARAVLDAGLAMPRDGRLVQQCAAGRIALRVADEGLIWLRLPAPTTTKLSGQDFAQLVAALGAAPLADAAAICVGPTWITAEYAHAPEVLALRPDMGAVAELSRRLSAVGVTVFGTSTQQADYEVRSFAPGHGIPEDPVCGSGNGCVAVYLEGLARARDYVARQGRSVGRDGAIHVAWRDGGIELGGTTRVCVRGHLTA